MSRVAPAEALRLTACQREVLLLLYDYGFLTARLLALVYGARGDRGGRGYWHLQRELRRLFDAGLVERFPGGSRTAPSGSLECVYVITHRGAREVLDAVEYAEVRHELYAREGKHRANFTHHVAIATLQLILTLGQSSWHLVDFRAEDRDPSACVRVRHRGRSLTAWPDASASIDVHAAKSSRRLRYLFEVDLTRKSTQRLADRFAAYAAYAAVARQGGVPATHAIVFAARGEREIERLIQIAAETVAAEKSGSTPPFLFWNLDDWYVAPGELRPPKAIVAARSLTSLAGDTMRLVEAGA